MDRASVEVSWSKDEALDHLERSDHLILGGDVARRIATALGTTVKVGSIQDTQSQFKGATINGAQEGDIIHDLIDATVLAKQLCRNLGVEYGSFFGRGSQLRECVARLRESVLDGGTGVTILEGEL